VEAILRTQKSIIANQNQLIASHVLDLLDQALEAIVMRFQDGDYKLPPIFTSDGSEPNVI
jgi:hypothetical protein